VHMPTMTAEWHHCQLSSAELKANQSKKQHGSEGKGVPGGMSMGWPHIEFGTFPKLIDARQ